MNLIARRNLFYIISAIIIIPGLISLFLWGLPLGIDFTGGSNLEVSFSKKVNNDDLKKTVTEHNIKVHSIRNVNNNSVIIRTTNLSQKEKDSLIQKLGNKFGKTAEKSFETVGPIVGNETKNNALKAVAIATLAITAFIAYAFREVSRPVASWKFAVAAIAALLHDVLVVIGVFSILGKLFGVEVDSLFITALLTVMGFSVHDTIVVFDRIRENLKKTAGVAFGQIVNNAILETFNRSLNTSLTVMIVLFSLLLFSGESIRWFVIALLIGVISGTYSSIFNAAPLLVTWHEWDKKRVRK